MKPHHRKKLSLNPETLRTLSPADTEKVVGGGITSIGDVKIDYSRSCFCRSAICSIGAACEIKA